METAESAALVERTMSFTASAGYLAFSTDNATLEEYLRSAESTGKSLRGTAGLAEGAEKVGGTEAGYFSFEDQAETWRILFRAFKDNPEAFNQAFSFMGSQPDGESKVANWFDVTLLPDFSAVAKYFSIAVMSGSVTPDGFLFQAYGPAPAGAR